MTKVEQQKITIEHPKLHATLNAYVRSIGSASIFKKNRKTKLLDEKLGRTRIIFNEGEQVGS